MKIINFDNVWKKFRKGEKVNSLRETLPLLFRAMLKNNGKDLRHNEFWALKNVGFEVKKGDILGIIGPNGAGKSTILKLLSRIMAPNKGNIQIKGRLSALIEITAGFHPDLTGRENLYLNGSILGMKKKEIDRKFEEIVEFSGLSDFIDTPIKRFSSGMTARLGFSVAAHMDPDILLVDEVLSVGDMDFQAKSAQKMRDLLKSGATIVFISHNLPLVQSLCKKVILLNKGEILKEGIPDEIIPYYENIVYGQKEEEIKKKIGVNVPQAKKEDAPIAISEVAFLDAKNKKRNSFKTNEPISIRIDFFANKIIEKPIFFLEIIRTDGIVCCSANTNNGICETWTIQGSGSISADFGMLNLAPGVYIIKISIYDKDLIHAYKVRKTDILKIETTPGIKNATGIFLPAIKWKI